MLKTAVLAGLVLLDDIKPKPINTISRVEKYITEPVPMLEIVPEPVKVKPKRKPRTKHICNWTDDVVWAVFTLGALLGAFIMYCI